MIFLVFVLLSVVVALMRGGRFDRLATIDLRFGQLIFVGLLIRILIFNSIAAEYLDRMATGAAYNVAMVLVWGTLALNWRLPGAPLMGVGVFLNWLVISLNGGFMPVSREGLIEAGLDARVPAMSAGEHYNHSILINESTRLPYLADVIAIPESFPLETVFSVGDVFLALGAAWLIQRAMVERANRDGVSVPTT